MENLNTNTDNGTTDTGVPLKRLVLRLAYCAKFDARWYCGPYGLRAHVDDVLSGAGRLVGSIVYLPCALAVLVLRPLVSPLLWIWNSTVNAERIDAIMAKSENEVAERRP